MASQPTPPTTTLYEVLLSGDQIALIRRALASARDADRSGEAADALDLLGRQLGEVLDRHVPVER